VSPFTQRYFNGLEQTFAENGTGMVEESCGEMAESSLNCLKSMDILNQVSPTLKDYIEPGVRILFVGINPGIRSTEKGHHFAGYSNRFWKLLYESRLVTEPLTYSHDWRLPEWQLGLTNIISRSSRGIDVLTRDEYRRGMARLTRKIRLYEPGLVALLGMTIFRIGFPDDECPGPGLTSVRLAGARVFLLPNPSGRNAHYSYARMLEAFRELRTASLLTLPSTRLP
jgi:double-stranded uracil-DNA glycosylase